MKEKMFYTAPEMEQVVVKAEVNFLTSGSASVETLNKVDGSWDED